MTLSQKVYRPQLQYKPAVDVRARDCVSAVERRVVIGDVHCPSHHSKSWKTAIAIARDFRAQRGIIMGDFLTMESLSRHPKTKPDPVRYAEECYQGNLLLDELQNTARCKYWHYIEGNHEVRAVRYVNEVGQLEGVLSVPEALYIRRRLGTREKDVQLRGMTWTRLEEQPLIVGPVGYLHGVSEAANYALQTANTKGPEVGCRWLTVAHMHTDQAVTSAAGYHVESAGWLGDQRLDEFQAYKKGRSTGWVVGILLQEVGANGCVSSQFVRITDGKAVFGNKCYSQGDK